MSEFLDLASLQHYLEEHAIDHLFGADIVKLFDKVKQSLPSDISEDQIMRCDWEALVFQIHFQDGDPNHEDLGNLLEPQAHSYLKRRLAETRNPILKARYSHTLWCIPGKKHAKYAKTAIEAYIELIKILDKRALDDAEGVFGFHLLLAIGNAFSLAHQTKFRRDEIKAEIKRLVFGFDLANPASFNLRRGLIRLMLDSRWKPKKEHLDGVAKICWTLYQQVFASGRVEVSIEALELGAKIDNRLGAKTHDWLIEKAACYEKLIDKYRNTPNEFMYCQEALAAYKEAKQGNKVRELERKYTQIKATMPVATFTEEIDLTEYLKTYKQLAQELARRDSGEIIGFLMCGKDLLRTYSETQESVEIQNQESRFIDRIPAHLTDARGHVIQHFREPEERLYWNLLQNYEAHLELGKLPLLNAIFAETIREGKLSSEVILTFLADHTWLGQTMVSTGPASMKIEYKWINLLAPSVRACFRLLDSELKGTPQTDDCVLGIDSLTVKLEGLLRELCESHGIPTFCVTWDRKGRKVFKEKDLNALLHEESLRDLISQDDLIFFKFLLVEHAGYNLRNKIAHCLMVSPESYLTDYVILVMIAVLRLAKYRLREAQSDMKH